MSDNKWTSNSGPGWESNAGKFYDTLLEKTLLIEFGIKNGSSGAINY